jgi:hypothetical protein
MRTLRAISTFLPSPVADRVIAGFAWAASLADPMAQSVFYVHTKSKFKLTGAAVPPSLPVHFSAPGNCNIGVSLNLQKVAKAFTSRQLQPLRSYYKVFTEHSPKNAPPNQYTASA